MGAVLQIRVSAWTYDEREMEKRWPKLVGLAWQPGVLFEPTKGVLEMVSALGQRLEAGLLADEQRNALGDGIRKAVALKQSLEDYLAEWKPADANKVSDELEDGLDQVEKLAGSL